MSIHSTQYTNIMLEDPEAFKKIMSASFVINILFFICSVWSIAWIFFTKPENIIWYVLCCFIFTYYLFKIISYKDYFNTYILHFRLTYDILNNISEMDSEEADEILSKLMSKEKKTVFLEERKTVKNILGR